MESPPPQVTRAVIQRFARLLERYSADLGVRPLVLPNGEFFPDHFSGDEESVALLLSRLQEHAGLADIPIECRVIATGSTPPEVSSCSSGACGVPQTGNGMARLIDQGGSWILQVPAAELRHPVALTTNLSRSLSFIFLVETQREGETIEPPVDVTADFIAVGLGFGALMLQGSYIYAKSCGGPQIASVTKVGISELAIAVALFAEIGAHKLAPALKTLEITQREALRDAHRIVRGNRKLIDALSREPKRITGGDFSLSESRGLFSGVLSKFAKTRTRSKDLSASLKADFDLEDVESLLMEMPPSSRTGRAKSIPPDGKRDELRNLVADALSESHA
jgi:hypothetical protein